MMRILRPVLAFATALAAILLAAPVVILGAPFWLTAVVTRGLARLLEPRSVHRWSLYEFDPVLGWRPRPKLDVTCLAKGDDVFHVVTGDDGWAGRVTIEECEILVLGDSHAFGYGIDSERSFANLRANPRIKPVGAPGYNCVQELLALRELSEKLTGKLVVWLVYPGNDLVDNLSPGMAGYRTPFVRAQADGRWEIVTHHLSPERWSASRGRLGESHLPTLAAIHSPASFLAQRAYDACAFILEQGASVCRTAGARLVVATVPLPAVLDERELARLRSAAPDPEAVDPDFPDRAIAMICEKVGVRFLPMKDVLNRTHFKRHDDHWTPAGHRRIADVLGRLHRGEEVGTSGTAPRCA
jgi:hypothetical protein